MATPSDDSDPQPVVLRPSWLASLSIAPALAVVLTAVSAALGQDLGQALSYAAVFSLVYLTLDRRRRVELGPDRVTIHETFRTRVVDRSEVQHVTKGQWGGSVRLSTKGRVFLLPVGDRVLGLISAERFALVEDWLEAY